MKRSMHWVVQVCLIATMATASAAAADVCLTFGTSTDLFRGRLAPVASGLLSLVFVEETFDRAAYGSAANAAGNLNIALTKPTNTATVTYACQIDLVQRAGPCQIQVLTADPLQGSRLDDVGFLDLNCTAGAATPSLQPALPAGEQMR
jgi:hypothetical protein